MDNDLQERLQRIRLFVMDVDGTLTDGLIILDSCGVETKHFNVKDGMGITKAHKAGIQTAIITARESKVVQNRAAELKISYVKQGIRDKVVAFEEILQQLNLEKEEAAFIGDDINDIEIARLAGASFAVGDAVEELKEVANYTLSKDGGKGAVREAIDLILKYRNQ